MWDMLGDDVLSSDYDSTLGEGWHGVDYDALLPEFRHLHPDPAKRTAGPPAEPTPEAPTA